MFHYHEVQEETTFFQHNLHQLNRHFKCAFSDTRDRERQRNNV